MRITHLAVFVVAALLNLQCASHESTCGEGTAGDCPSSCTKITTYEVNSTAKCWMKTTLFACYPGTGLLSNGTSACCVRPADGQIYGMDTSSCPPYWRECAGDEKTTFVEAKTMCK